jgi:hypothetical protein
MAQQPININKIDSTLPDKIAYEDKDVLVKRMFANTATDTLTPQINYFKAKFETKYRSDDEFNYRQINETYNFWQQLKKRIIELLKKLFGYAPDAPNPEIISLIVKILSALVVIAVLIIIIRIYIRNRNRSIFGKKDENLTIDINDSEQLIQLANFSTLIAEHEKKQDHRICVRLYFLWVLKSLKEQNAIVWLPDKTNSTYANELRDKDMQETFNYLAYVYEYVWYGEFALSDTDYLKAKETFEGFIKKGGTK